MSKDKQSLNNKINELYNKIDAQDSMINQQALEIARLKDKIEEIKNNRNDITKDEVYLNMKKETLVKTINLKRDTISYLASERRKLQQRIDKAIEYIKEYQETQAKYCYVDFDKEDIDKLLEILGDKENENISNN